MNVSNEHPKITRPASRVIKDSDIQMDLKNRIANSFIKTLFEKDLITKQEYEKIKALNDRSFTPLYCDLIA